VYYDSEQRYYDQYSDAYFGYTMKKGGWDCMRHHEIIAAGALPYFYDFDNCPHRTLHNFDRGIFQLARETHDTWDDSNFKGHSKEQWWYYFMEKMRETSMSTKQIAQYVLEKVCQS